MQNLAYKIALVCDHFYPRVGGIELHVAELAQQLRQRGHDAQILTPLPGPCELHGVPVHRLPASILPKKEVVWRTTVFKPLQACLTKERFDLVHAHSSIISPFAYGSLYVAKRLGLPSILTTHSILDPVVWGLFKGLNGLTHWSRLPTVFTSISSAAAQKIKRLTGRSQLPILHNGIDLKSWSLSSNLQSPLRISSVMRLSRRKRPLALIKAIQKINQSLPIPQRPHWTIIGDGPYRKILETKIQRWDLKSQVQCLGYVSRNKIQQVLSESQLYVLPTRREAFGLSLLEARAAGLPIVAMNSGGIPDVVKHHEHGLLCASDEEFRKAILHLIQDESLRKKMAQQSRENLQVFSWEVVIANHLKLYQSVMARNLSLLS